MTPTSSGPNVHRATILDVAAAAGVSRQTVTRAMNDMPGISASTRERVQRLAAELGYSPSRFAKGLVQGARTSLGLAIPDLTNPYFPAFASSVVEEATQRGWNVVVDDFGHGSGTGLDAVERPGRRARIDVPQQYGSLLRSVTRPELTAVLVVASGENQLD